MNFAEQRKKDVAFTISENPVQITIERTTKTASGGGRKVDKSTLGPYTVRIFQQGVKQITVNASATTAGTRQDAPMWAFLADADADIQCTSAVTDEFTALGQRFRVTAASERYWQGVKTSVDGLLKVVS